MQLAPLVDAGLLHLEGLVPRGNNNVYSMPVRLYCFGEPERVSPPGGPWAAAQASLA